MKSDFCCFYQKYVVLFLLHLLHTHTHTHPSPPCCPIYFPSLIIRFPPRLLPALSPLCLIHCILTTCKVWLYREQCSIGYPLGHAFLKNMAVLQKAPPIQILYFSMNCRFFAFKVFNLDFSCIIWVISQVSEAPSWVIFRRG